MQPAHPASRSSAGALARPPHALGLFDFARAGGDIGGRVSLSMFTRLRDGLATTEGEPVTWSLRGWLRERQGARQQPMVTLEIRADLPLVCQRCLQAMTHPVVDTADFRLVLTEPELTQDELDAEDDALPAEHPVDVLDLIEDQLILALPIVPMHAQCPQLLQGSTVSHQDNEPELPQRENPFANLRQLLKNAKPD